MALVAGEIQRFEHTGFATLTGQLQPPAVEGIEDGGNRLLLPFPTGADGIKCFQTQGPHRAGEQIACLGQPHLAAING